MSLRLDRPSLQRAAVLLFGGGAAGLLGNAVRSAGVPFSGIDRPALCGSTSTSASFTELSPHEASHLCGQAGIVFVDARPAARFAEGHVAGAHHLPCNVNSPGATFSLRNLDHAETIIVYGESSEDAREVAGMLRQQGVQEDVRVLRGGFSAWERAGLACVSGSCRECTLTGSKEHAP